MVTTATLQLYKDVNFDIFRMMSNFASLSAQNNYYNGLTALTKQVTFNKIGDPFILDESIEDLIDYIYGRVQYNGKYFYFQIDDIAVNAQGRSIVSYTIDVWETMRYQYRLELGAGTIDRISCEVIGPNGPIIDSDVVPYFNGVDFPVRAWQRLDINSSARIHPCVYALVYSNTENIAYYTMQRLNDNDEFRINIMQIVQYMMNDLKDSGQQPLENITMIGAWFSMIDISDNSAWIDTNKEHGTRTYYCESNAFAFEHDDDHIMQQDGERD